MTDSDFVNILWVFLNNFDSFCLILFIFTHTITIRQCMFERKIGTEGSVLQELCHLVILTIRCLYYDCCTYFVKSTPLRAFSGSFQHFADVLQTY